MEEKDEGKQDCSGLDLVDKVNCLVANSFDTISDAAGSAGGSIADTYNNIVGNKVDDETDSAFAPSSAAAVASFRAAAVASTIFALIY